MEVASEMEVDLLDWLERRVAAAGRASLHAEYGTKWGLPECGDGSMPELREPLRDADGIDRLPFAAGCRRNRGHKNELAAPLREAIEGFEPNFGDVPAVGFKKILG